MFCLFDFIYLHIYIYITLNSRLTLLLGTRVRCNLTTLDLLIVVSYRPTGWTTKGPGLKSILLQGHCSINLDHSFVQSYSISILVTVHAQPNKKKGGFWLRY